MVVRRAAPHALLRRGCSIVAVRASRAPSAPQRSPSCARSMSSTSPTSRPCASPHHRLAAHPRLRDRGALRHSSKRKPGRGKTHLAIALAYRAMQNGFDALFTTMQAELIDELSAASKDGKLPRCPRPLHQTARARRRRSRIPPVRRRRGQRPLSRRRQRPTHSPSRDGLHDQQAPEAMRATFSTTTTSPRPSSIGSLSVGDCSDSTGPRSGPSTCRTTSYS